MCIFYQSRSVGGKKNPPKVLLSFKRNLQLPFFNKSWLYFLFLPRFCVCMCMCGFFSRKGTCYLIHSISEAKKKQKTKNTAVSFKQLKLIPQ